MSEHIWSSYDDELNEVRSIVIQMGDRAVKQLVGSMEALRELDHARAVLVSRSDKELDALELTAERAVIGVFARRAPVADDLREVVAALKMTTMIERIGDYAKNIAKRTNPIAEGELVVMPQLLEDMAKAAQQMVERVMDAYLNRDADEALAVWESDEVLDDIYTRVYRRILERMAERPDHINVLTHYLMIAKNLERIGDQATNVAEQIYYAITGDNLEEARSKGDETSVELFQQQ